MTIDYMKNPQFTDEDLDQVFDIFHDATAKVVMKFNVCSPEYEKITDLEKRVILAMCLHSLPE